MCISVIRCKIDVVYIFLQCVYIIKYFGGMFSCIKENTQDSDVVHAIYYKKSYKFWYVGETHNSIKIDRC